MNAVGAALEPTEASTLPGLRQDLRLFSGEVQSDGPPAIVFFDVQGLEAEKVRVVGFQDADAFLATQARVN